MPSAPVAFHTSDYLGVLARSLHGAYQGAEPFPHVIMDAFLPEATLGSVLDEFPGPEGNAWRTNHADERQLKFACEDWESLGPVTRQTIAYLNSGPFLRFLEELTGIEGLVADPHLKGGGLHQVLRGGFLSLHADFNWYARLKLDRRLNLLLYLNRDWREEWGGALELWSADMSRCSRRVVPEFNRCVLFSTTERSFHGHPEPLCCPDGRTRKSLALYYYTNGRPEAERAAPHSTAFQKRPQDGPKLATSIARALRRERSRRLVRSLVPPICWEGLAALKRRLAGARR